MALFQNSVLTKFLNLQDKALIAQKWEVYKKHFLNPEIQENIRNSKEEQYQGEFLIDLFVNVLGYTKNPTPNFNLTTELKNEKDSKKADGGIIVDGKVVAVIELKGTNTTDLSKIEVQGFGYKNNQKDCVYVITSNFEKLRFYIDNAIEHVEFNLFTLSEKDFDLLYMCLAYNNIANNIPKKIKEDSVSQEDKITKSLYKDYSLFKNELFQSLCVLNPEFEPLELFKKSQKLLDRFLFIFFAEDRQLLPPNSVRLILEDWKDLREKDAYTPLYGRYKKYFEYLNTGFKGKRYDVFAYNGGLFKPDEILDVVKIDDDILYKHTLKLSTYDFVSEVDVNILGHIFENSLNELDEMKAKLEGEEIDKSKTKRKKDGVFYTPKYITKYIVENTVGKLSTEKKAEIKLVEEEYTSDKKRNTATKKVLLDKLTDYRNWLLKITIIDPACGSGAFLNEALNFLIAEHSYIDELQAKLMGYSLILSDVEKSILENNLFGVDLNEESVEIAKLSLWLRKAQPNRKLNDLNNNIKCGNSLIDDPEIAGDKAFSWQNEFPQIFENGGFDVVIGNPPYVRPHNIIDKEKVYLWEKYFVASQKTDLYAFFTEKGGDLLKIGGILGYIMPKTWMSIHSFFKLRELILKNYKLEQIGILPSKVFEDAIVETGIIVFEKSDTKSVFKYLDVIENKIIKYENQIDILLNANLNFSENEQKTITDSLALGEIFDIIVGIATGDDKKYCRFEKLSELDKEAIRGANISRYLVTYTGEYVWYNREQMITDGNNKPKSSLKLAVGQSSPKKPSDFELPEKIVMQRISKKIIAALDTNQYYAHTSVVILKPKQDSKFKNKYVLAILNSSYINFWLQTNSSNVSINVGTVKNIPIKNADRIKQIDFEDNVDLISKLSINLQEQSQKFQRAIQRKFELETLPKKLQDWYQLSYEDFVKELAKLKIKLSLSQEAEWEEFFTQEAQKAQTIKAEIDATDKKIDEMVYELYELTPEEIAIVEGS
ncbi:Eco57I restriction-modification methylase domain-containing protein [Lacihabitans soyangensis]|uniref:site-specific DNA-methyltransferase (adenine-specific) n=1 Tax=Lacihabitans soyangensis TaxID=869394 RepID=A0AAE3KTB9_9BACT|nr:TaqI-like C-terminal specificity domain-containing protein [Lacihabitans soyangensis]MCP9763569.1 restriction endonuclease subunit M [Lacihabitans soyangensis]